MVKSTFAWEDDWLAMATVTKQETVSVGVPMAESAPAVDAATGSGE